MQCPFCKSDISPGAVSCEQCGATKVTRRTTLGIFVGWVGMIVALIWIMLWFPLVFLPFVGYDMGKYPWVTLVVGTFVAAGLLWYSKSTLHAEWIGPND